MRIACVLANDFEDSEFRIPYDRFRAAGCDVDVVGLKGGATLTGKRGKESGKTDLGIDDADPDDFDALFSPGGFSPDQLRADPRMVEFVRAFNGKPIFAVCHGPQLLIAADLYQGRRLTAWKTIQDDLRRMGADVVDEPAVVDGNLVTSRQPSDLDVFASAALSVLQVGEGVAPTA